MIRFGDLLYRLGPKDANTIALEPFFRTETDPALGIGTAQAFHTWSPPIDRAFYVCGMGLSWNPGVPSSVAKVRYAVKPRSYPTVLSTFRQWDRSISDIIGDRNSASGPNNLLTMSDAIDMLLPPGVDVSVEIVRVDTTTAGGTPTFWICGWLVPAGNLGRTF